MINPYINSGVSTMFDLKTRSEADGGVFELNQGVNTLAENLNDGTFFESTLQIFPNAVKTLKVYGTIPNSTNSDMVWTRASTATRINESGVLESVATGVPRIDYTDGMACILVEPERTNYFTYSNEFENAEWIKSFATVTDNNATGIDGTLSASLLNDNNSGGTGGVNIQDASFTVQSGDNVFSVYAKKGSLDWMRLQTTNFDAGGTGNVYFDLENGVLGTETTITGTIESAPNGFYKCSVYFNTTSDLSGALKISLSEGDGDVSVPRDGTSNIYITSAQQEAGSYGTSYIPTSGATATRETDTGTGCGTSAEFNSEDGCIFLEISALANDLTDRFISFSDGTANNTVEIQFSTVSNEIKAIFTKGGSAYLTSSNTTAYTITDFNKILFSWANNDYNFWINGTEVSTSTGSTAFTANTLDTCDLNDSSANPFYGRIRQIQSLGALTDTEKTNLTT